VTVEVLIAWAIRIVLAVLAFVLVKWALPLLLGLGGISIPDSVVVLLALLVGLLVLAGGWYWHRHPPAP
jgi:hypothetical protein